MTACTASSTVQAVRKAANMKVTPTLILSVALASAIGTAASAKVSVRESTFEGLKSIVMESQSIRLTILPERGANIASLYDKSAKREWAWHNDAVKYRIPKYDDSFADYDMSGMDDCFPTIGKEKYFAYPWKDVEMPDHGELWSQPWKYSVKGDSLTMSVHGVRFPYRFTKTISIDDASRTVTIRYSAENHSTMPIPAAWAGHYITAIKPGMKAFLPKDVQFVSVPPEWVPERKDNLAWTTFGGYDTGIAAKFFTKELTQGFTGFYDPATKDYMLYRFSTHDLPYLGIWIDQCGYPVGSHSYHAGLEPTNGAETPWSAREMGRLRYLMGKSTMTWKMEISFGKSDESELYEKVR